ncbi:MAG: hypothetical protein U0V02_16635 [Anaerolineales bacterium]
MTEHDLMNFWNFDDTDLSANRLGQLTEKQKKILVGEHKSQRGVLLGVGAVVAVLFLCLPILLIGSRMILPMLLSGGFSDVRELLPFAAIGGFAIIFIGIAVLTVGAVVAIYVVRANKKADITVKRVEGNVNYVWGTKRIRTPNSSVRKYEDVRVLHLTLGDKKFEVKEQLQELIKDGEAWVVYYTSYPFKFLSAEKISKENH